MTNSKMEDIIENTQGVIHMNVQSSDNAYYNNEEHLAKERQDKISNLIKQKKSWITYIILAFIVWMGYFIRTRNIPLLKDVTTGDWTLGPDLDPFLFLRWAKEIVENGSLAAVDTLRNVPLGYNTAGEAKLLSYLMVWFHKILDILSLSDSVTYSSIIFPAFMFALTIIAFFLFARKIFYRETKFVRNLIALIATALFTVVPSLLPRTIAGIPEKESAAFFFMFIAFYFFMSAFTARNPKKGLLFGVLAGIATGAMALIWGGVTFVFLSISAAVFFAFLLGKINKQKFYIFTAWVFSSLAVMMPFSTRYTVSSLISSTSTGMALGVFFILLVDYILFKKRIINVREKIKWKLPNQIISLIIAVIILTILTSIFINVSFVPDKVIGTVQRMVHPVDVSRFGLTVAENRQPFFISDWKNNFGPQRFGIPLFFWMFFAGSIVLFNLMIEKLNSREKLILTFSYFILLMALIFSKYKDNTGLDGDTMLSLIVYFGGFIFFIGVFAHYYFKRYKQGDFSVFREFNFGYILYFVMLTMTIVGARAAVRLIMVLAAVSPVAIAFLTVRSIQKYSKQKDDIMKFIYGALALIIIFALAFTFITYYRADVATASSFGLGPYQQQWQQAMSWVRDNTPTDAVFAHWWDYGYWIQSIGERATILDGGNAIVYWNHLMGRHVLTGPDERTALEFLYAHDGTHLLIDSTEIGKYTAYASIGADEDYDRMSWIPTLFLEDKQTQETSEGTAYFYAGGTGLDEDIIWNQDGKEILLPQGEAGLGGIILTIGNNGEVEQPIGIFVYNNQQYNIPLRKVYYNGELKEFDSGFDAGIFIFPRVDLSSGGASINPLGTLLYLSPRTVNSGIARYYLFEEKSDYFKLAHTESNFLVKTLRGQGAEVGEIVYANGFQGPIKIWEIDYPNDIELKEEFLEIDYPNRELYLAQEGRY